MAQLPIYDAVPRKLLLSRVGLVAVPAILRDRVFDSGAVLLKFGFLLLELVKLLLLFSRELSAARCRG